MIYFAMGIFFGFSFGYALGCFFAAPGHRFPDSGVGGLDNGKTAAEDRDLTENGGYD